MSRNTTQFLRAIGSFRLLSISLFTLAVAISASGYTLIHGFAGAPSDGANPQYGALVTDGTSLYGFTENGGTNGVGTVFKVNPNGSGYHVIHSFNGVYILNQGGDLNDGAVPLGSPLIVGSTIYGMTSAGGTNNLLGLGETQGTIFRINTDGTGFSLLHTFSNAIQDDGYTPYGSLVTDNTNLFGMTSTGNTDEGNIFSIAPGGTNFVVMHRFGSILNDGAAPDASFLLSGGVLYGMTTHGGSNGVGTIFTINTSGAGYHIIHHFTGMASDGASPYGSLIISNSTLYGTTSGGGLNGHGTVFSVSTNGTNFQLLHSFSATELQQPEGDLTLSNSTLYGMASTGGTNGLGFGGVFEVNTDGTGYQFVHAFSFVPFGNQAQDGSSPFGSLLLFNSQLYGMTHFGGSTTNAGAVFSLAGGNGGGGGGVGSLKVTILPAAVVTAGAQWEVDGPPLFNSGDTVANLSVGQHTVLFKDVSGWATAPTQFINITANNTTSITGTYIQLKPTVPTVTIVSPTAGLHVSNGVYTATGTSSDTVKISGVYYQLNGGPWTPVTTANKWTNWSATNLNLTAGPNRFSAYAIDKNNDVSTTNTVAFTYVVSAPLVVNISGVGTIKPNLNGAVEQIGNTLSMAAKAGKGWSFIGWSGSFSTNNPKLTFVMASNLEFTANFKDITRPVNAIVSPKKNQLVTNLAPVASGKAKDNAGVTSVWFAVNGGGWMAANLPDGTNWTTPPLTLPSGSDSISAFAQDAAGNNSLTNIILFKYVVEPVADWAPDSLNGLLASVTPTNGPAESVGFDPSTFAQAGIGNDSNADDYGAGTYSYVKTDTNMAQLSLAFTNPPSSSNDLGPITLVFTNHYSGYFTNGDDGSTGGFNVAIATAFTPSTVIAKTITATSANNAKVTTINLSTGTFVKTPANNSNTGSSSGNYTFTRYSPVGGMFSLAFTDAADAGATAYLQTTFTSATGGSYFVLIFDNTGTLQDTDNGTFILK
jgi:uncharacterized repeat protein (TIGR03803 family)